MTNTSPGQVSSLTVLGCVILCLNQCEQRSESPGPVPKLPPSSFILAQHAALRQRGDTYGSPGEVCVLLTQPHSLTHSLTRGLTKSSVSLSYTDSAGIIS